ncbi:MAG: ABC transporter substrate-binding protein [Candidatus Krumholzibacteriia bacterium]
MVRRLSSLAVSVVVLIAGCQKVQVRPARPTPRPPVAVVRDTTASVVPARPDTTVVVRLTVPEVEVQRSYRVHARVGVLAPFSGRYAAYGKAYLDGARLAVDSFNDLGPVQVEVVPADTRGQPLSALAAVRRLAGAEDVVAILGGVLNLPTLVAAVEANCRGVPLLSNVATEDGIRETGPYVFHQVASRQRAASAAADLAAFRLRRFRAAVLYPEEGEGRVLASGFAERMGALGGRIVASESFAAGTTDFTSLVRRIRAAQPDVLFVPAGVEDMLLIAPTLAVQGVEAQLIGTEKWKSERLLGGTGVELEGALVPAGEHEGDHEELARFRELYADRYGPRANRFAAAGYLAARRILDVLAQRPEADREALRTGLEARGAPGDRRMPVRFLVVRDGEPRAFGTP